MSALATRIQALCALALLFAAPASVALDAPPPLQLEHEQFTVSGLSSGAAMAVQMGVAHSARVRGIGIVSGPPYLCAQGLVTKATNDCLTLGRTWLRELFGPMFGLSLFSSGERDIEVQDLIADTNKLAQRKRIDPVANMAGQRIWEYRGSKDRVVGVKASAAQHAFFLHFNGLVVRGEPRPTPHTLPTSDPGQGACDVNDEDFVSGCDFDAAGYMLRSLYKRPRAKPDEGAGQWYALRQSDYVPMSPGMADPDAAMRMLGLAESAHVFVPAQCMGERCAIHVALHGCQQGMTDEAFRAFSEGGGYVRWAGPLRLVLLFPRVGAIKPLERGSWDSVGNPMGCWDWWGYTTPADLYGYATRDAPQIRTLMNMVDRLGKPE
jgi:poly(3-hydroxybutyrate) depolymerase